METRISKLVKTVTLTEHQYERLRDGVSGVAEISSLCNELATKYSLLPCYTLVAIVNPMFDVFEEVAMFPPKSRRSDGHGGADSRV
jgi:hypothetical protein